MRLFWRSGYAATSMAELTQAMRIGSPSLYAAFGSKEALYAEALAAFDRTREARVWARFRAARSAREAMRCWLMDSAASYAPSDADEPPGCMVTLSAIAVEGSAELAEQVRTLRARGLGEIQERVADAIATGELKAGTDAAGLARFFLAVQGGLSLQARDGAVLAELEAAAHAAMMIWDAVASEPGIELQAHRDDASSDPPSTPKHRVDQ